MNSDENNTSESEQNKAEEPETAFKTVRVFRSFEEEEEYTAKQRAAMSHDERMKHVEGLRKRVFHQYLLSDGTWPSISDTFKIVDPYISDTGQ